MSRNVISSKVIARDLERTQHADSKPLHPAKTITVIIANLLLCGLIIAIVAGLNLF